MSLMLHKRDASDRYKVSIVANGNSKLDSSSPKGSKGLNGVRTVMKKTVSALMALVFFCLAFLGAVATAAPAQAGNFVEDGFKAAFCASGMFNYDLSKRTLGPTTGDNTSDGWITPYEKYGTAGLQYTVWLGPEQQDGLDDEGKFGGVSIVNFAGGKDASEIDTWGDKVADADKNGATSKFPGFYNTKQTCVPVDQVAPTAIANVLLQTAGEIVHITNLVYQTATESSASVIKQLEPTIVKIVNNLKDAVFFEFLTLMITISALWMAWIGLVKRQSTQVASGAGWMIGAAVASVFMLSNPMWLPNIVNDTVNSVSDAGMNSITSVTSITGSDNMCAAATSGPAPTRIDESDGNKFTPAGNADTRKMIRQMQCTMWYSFLYTPWVMGEFGTTPADTNKNSALLKDWEEAQRGGEINGNQQLTKRPAKAQLGGYEPNGTNQNWALFHLDNKINYPNLTQADRENQQRALLNVANAQLHKDTYNTSYKGEDGAGRMATAGTALIASVGAGLMIVIVSLSIIILQLGLVIMVLVSPLFFLVGVHPGFGRKIALGWLETIAGLAIKRIVLSVILSVMLVFYSSVLAASATMPWLVSMIMVIAVSIGGVMYKDKILSMFNRISFGGSGAIAGDSPLGNSASRFAKRSARRALGMSTGDISTDLKDVLNNRGAGGKPGSGSGNGDSSGAGGKPSKRQTEKERAAAEVAARNAAEEGGEGSNADGAGGRPPSGEGSNGDTEGSSESASPDTSEDQRGTEEGPEVDASGAGGRPVEYSGAESGAEGEDGSASDTSGAGGRPDERAEVEGESQTDASGAGGRPQEYGDSADGLINKDGRTAQEVADEITGTPATLPAGSSASAVALANMKRPAGSERISVAEPAPSPSNAALNNMRRSGQPAQAVPVTSDNSSRQLPNAPVRRPLKERVVQKKREVFNEPVKELRQMASSADAAFGNPVKKTVGKAAYATQVAGNKISTNMDNRWDDRKARQQFEEDVRKQVSSNRKTERENNKARAAELRRIPKEYRNNV